jgi:hypothetical protein
MKVSSSEKSGFETIRISGHINKNKLDIFGFKLLFYIAVILCFSQLVSAQSGRRLKQPTPTPTPVSEVKPTVSDEENQPSEKIETLILAGEIQENAFYVKSNYIDAAIKECQFYLEFPVKLKLKTEKGGKMNLKEAKERAEKETDAHVLWIGFVMKDDSYGKSNVDYVEYIVLKPKSGKKLTFGRITAQSINRQRGIIGLPNTSKRATELSQIREFSRELMGILIKGGWLTV